MKTRLGGRTWAALLTFGLFGQIAWVIENMYFNVFLYNTISGDTSMIAAMVAWSAVTATVTTLVMGALSDRLGRRKALIVIGYLLWGVSIGAFAFIKRSPLAGAAHGAAVLVVVMDCVMTFFGSTANDAAFNAWVTDVTVPENRGRVETVLAIMPLVAMLVVFGALDGLTQAIYQALDQTEAELKELGTDMRSLAASSSGSRTCPGARAAVLPTFCTASVPPLSGTTRGCICPWRLWGYTA